MDELLNKAAEKMGMPPALAERSAQAKAEKTGTTVEAILREWAGEEAADGDTADEAPPEASSSEAAASADTPSSPQGTSPTEVTVDYLVALAAEAKRMPPKLVKSSAEARARNAKTDVETVLAMWAGVDLQELEAQAAAGTAPAVAVEPAGPPATEEAPAEAAETPAPEEAPAEPEATTTPASSTCSSSRGPVDGRTARQGR